LSEVSDVEPKQTPPKKRRWRQYLKWLAIGLVVLVVAVELILRFVVGLGDPPLLVSDPDMEYRFAPSQTVHRFGNLVHYNAYSQRADDFPEHKTNSQELRVLMVGDSVINGGVQTDQSQLINTLLQRRLSDALHRPVIVGNASAASWGPPNELAYVKKFGFFDADVVVLVLNDEDAFDAMTFDPVVGRDPDYPNHKPILALTELFTRYLPRFTARFKAPPSAPPSVPQDQALPICMDAIRQFVSLARAHGAFVLMGEQHELFFESRASMRPMLEKGRAEIEHIAQDLNVPLIEWDAQLKQAEAQGKQTYRAGDFIHPSLLGDQIIADALYQPILDALTQSTTQPAR